MKLAKWLELAFLSIFIIMLVLPGSAHAYLDPGTGSVVTSVILGFLAAIAYTFRKYMYRLKDFLYGNKSSENKNNQGTSCDN